MKMERGPSWQDDRARVQRETGLMQLGHGAVDPVAVVEVVVT